MRAIAKNIDRKKWVAAIAGMTLPGMGQVYNGELFKGFCFFAIFLMVQLIGYNTAVRLPGGGLAVGILVTSLLSLALYGIALYEAARTAARHGKGYCLKTFNRWYFYIAAWMFCSIFIMGSMTGFIKRDVIEVYKIVGSSMQPQVVPGDLVIVDKTAYAKMPPAVGDIIIHVFPDDRSKVFIRRIEALPGDRVTLEDGSQITVPHGSIYVMGDNREKSMDSRDFGSVPLSDVLGKARQVLVSRGGGGVRWDRIGRTL